MHTVVLSHTPITLTSIAYGLSNFVSYTTSNEVCHLCLDFLPSFPYTHTYSTAHGDALALGKLAQVYLPVAANMAAEMNCEEIHLADLIQEANVALLEALEQEKPQVKNDQWLRLQLRKGILAAIEEQTERKFQDDSLVARVEKLESAVKELTDDDGETRFTLDELAVILDMKTDEIRDVLRLTGDDK